MSSSVKERLKESRRFSQGLHRLQKTPKLFREKTSDGWTEKVTEEKEIFSSCSNEDQRRNLSGEKKRTGIPWDKHKDKTATALRLTLICFQGIYIATCQAWDAEDSLYTCELETVSQDPGKKDPSVPEEMEVNTAIPSVLQKRSSFFNKIPNALSRPTLKNAFPSQR
ncbi:hypothetical protein Y1Q_0001020 [Alligator mississippiensis]|uniref:Uncharacterized protein n=1 Tax=Alligator mississippiensis TaxID=8496 RepID=A0A151NE90_ALLMI|nr:hypothetical protein Y1Q_0001020 [Alligator mississippiensis]